MLSLSSRQAVRALRPVEQMLGAPAVREDPDPEQVDAVDVLHDVLLEIPQLIGVFTVRRRGQPQLDLAIGSPDHPPGRVAPEFQDVCPAILAREAGLKMQRTRASCRGKGGAPGGGGTGDGCGVRHPRCQKRADQNKACAHRFLPAQGGLKAHQALVPLCLPSGPKVNAETCAGDGGYCLAKWAGRGQAARRVGRMVVHPTSRRPGCDVGVRC